MFSRPMVPWALLLAVMLFWGAWRAGRSPQSEPVSRSGTLPVALHTEPRTLNPDVAGDETADVVAANVFGRLVVVDVDGRLLPDLAERWTVDTEASRGLPSVPAIAPTAYARAEDRSRALKAGYWSISASRWTPQR